ncbi:hypothetical protein LTR94_037043, partial [Friedmanniomyces endolithicus]
GGDPGPVAGPEAGRLGVRAVAARCRRAAGHGLYPGAGGRDLLHHVPADAGRHGRADPGVRHHAVHAARLQRSDARLSREDRPQGRA